MKWWCAAFSTVCWVLPQPAAAADDLAGAARELARKTAAWAGRGEAVAISWRNISSLNSSELAAARAAFESALRQAGGRTGDGGAIEAQITLSETPSQYLMVVEARRGEDRQVWIAAWKRIKPVSRMIPGLSLEKKLLWEQDEPILDLAITPDGMVILSPAKLTWVTGQTASKSQPLAPGTPSRDPRGRLRANGAGFEAYLPGATCRIASAGSPVECRSGDEVWPLDSAGHSLSANYAPGRNYFDGRITSETGLRKTFTPFYSAAAIEEDGKTLWVLAMIDGRAQVFDAAFEPQGGALTGWGSDIAGTGARCNGTGILLTTRTGDASEPDAIQAVSISNGGSTQVGAALEMRGPVTALWPSIANGAVAVVRDPQTGKYAAYLIAIVCGA